jgi:aryl-alcohol dehydrogenase-like predicted oxidoreductase
MLYKKLGRTGLKVSTITLGCMTLGLQVGESESLNVIKSALDLGINSFDTANGYAGGKSEQILGTAVKGQRNSVIIATKVSFINGPGPNDSGLSRKHIMNEVEGSLKRLQTDYIDIYYAHFPDFDTMLEETLRTMDDLVHQGKVRYIGCSNYPAWLLCKALWKSDKLNLARFDSLETPYNLLTRDIEVEVLPLCADEGLGVAIFNPLAGEMLTGRHEYGKPPAEGRFTLKDMGPGYLERFWNESNFQALDRFKVLAKAHGCTLPQFSLAWILNNGIVSTVLSGSISPEQIKENVAAIDIKMTPEDIKTCNDVWAVFRPARFHYARDSQWRK